MSHGLAVRSFATVADADHPNGVAEMSLADRSITDEVKRAFALIGVRVLDHFVVGSSAPVSFAERGLL
jgi:DNA repair protein RadC